MVVRDELNPDTITEISGASDAIKILGKRLTTPFISTPPGQRGDAQPTSRQILQATVGRSRLQRQLSVIRRVVDGEYGWAGGNVDTVVRVIAPVAEELAGAWEYIQERLDADDVRASDQLQHELRAQLGRIRTAQIEISDAALYIMCGAPITDMERAWLSDECAWGRASCGDLTRARGLTH
jgi:hypothetical protein